MNLVTLSLFYIVCYVRNLSSKCLLHFKLQRYLSEDSPRADSF